VRRIGVPGLVVALVVMLGTGVGASLAAFTATTSNAGNSFSAAAVDSTPPTISRAVAAKPSGATPATIRQGGDYYVYAEVTDASAIASVTANLSTVDAGVTATALSSGSWTVGGQSYNYRSALLTANTPLITGTSYSYSVTATDALGNGGSQTYSVAIETYEQVVEATSGLVSLWRMGSAPTVADGFTGTAGATLQSRAGELGATWTKHAWSTVDGVTSDAGRLRKNGTGRALYHASGTPASASYAVEADVHVKSLAASDMAGVAGRVATAASTFYLARYEVPTASWTLIKVVNGTRTALGSFAQTLTAGSTYRVRLDMSGTTIRVFVDGVQRISVTDAGIAAAGRGGVVLGDDATAGAAVSDTVGLHLDNVRVVANTGTTMSDAFGTNPGTFANSPLLNVSGALVGDFNGATSFNGTNQYASVPDASSLDRGDGPLSTEAWVRRDDATTGYHDILNKGAGSLQWAFNGSDHRLVKAGTGTIASATGAAADTTAYHHWVATKNGAVVKLYRDGVDVTPATITNQTLGDTATALYLATKDGTAVSGEFLKARLDEVAIYSQALPAATVLDHYKVGTGTG
jgi:hypothetical protein